MFAKYPFSDYVLYVRWHRKLERFMADLVSPSHRTTMSYARYLMSVKLGRRLNKSEEVDHIDENKRNDVIENLQLLSPSENKAKYAKSLSTPLFSFVCPVCGETFKRSKQRSYQFLKYGKQLCCSKTCGDVKKGETLRQDKNSDVSILEKSEMSS